MFANVNEKDQSKIVFKEGPQEKDIRYLQIIKIKQCKNEKHITNQVACDCVRTNKSQDSNFLIVLFK
jgi:hypothetical protein